MQRSSDYAKYDDEELISLIIQRREEALTQLYERYKNLVFSIAVVIVDDRRIAEEIMLDVFMRVWQKAASYDVKNASVRIWLTHIVHNHAIDVVRRRSTRPDRSALDLDKLTRQDAPLEENPSASAELASRRAKVLAALNSLPYEQEQVLLLAYFGGYSQYQIAELLQEPIGTIKTRMRLAMKKLRAILGGEKEPEDQRISLHS
jgi:RNA polymerase sigma-70 factor, ECF subfamily